LGQKDVRITDFFQHWETSRARSAVPNICLRQWFRRRGCKNTPNSFDLVKIREKFLKIRAKSVEIRAKSVKTLAKSLKIWVNSLKIRAKMGPNVV